ncbi:hypothetical protein [Leptospira yasudae]|uniref:Uncharacterized protein n=1 Tax=Leptospira yasudae TaxID=2202201 RepID=A0A6N4QVA2_9LEPT|nr:hypothetical protein [Leptospira yasudae]TGL75106.1 hypothetical protein EHQ72_16510 [Leptospira yasudae]TGL77918.1 hypothetical protein EHQ77_15095 [Leptospira yasudae]TGL87054.1 hypothetical protein EHQ83_05090 [Leptospira yasudae]
MNPRFDQDSRSGIRKEELARVYSKVKLYCLASGITDPIELHEILTRFLRSLETKPATSSAANDSDWEEETMKLFLKSGSVRSEKKNESGLPAIEPSSMIPNPVDFGPLGDLAEPKEKLEPVAVIFSVLFWGIVYASLLYGLLS